MHVPRGVWREPGIDHALVGLPALNPRSSLVYPNGWEKWKLGTCKAARDLLQALNLSSRSVVLARKSSVTHQHHCMKACHKSPASRPPSLLAVSFSSDARNLTFPPLLQFLASFFVNFELGNSVPWMISVLFVRRCRVLVHDPFDLHRFLEHAKGLGDLESEILFPNFTCDEHITTLSPAPFIHLPTFSDGVSNFAVEDCNLHYDRSHLLTNSFQETR